MSYATASFIKNVSFNDHSFSTQVAEETVFSKHTVDRIISTYLDSSGELDHFKLRSGHLVGSASGGDL